MEMIKMSHPDIPKTKDEPVVRSRRQFEAVWKDKGWKEVAAPKAGTDSKETK